MISIGIVDTDGFERLASTIRSVYGLKSSRGHYSRDFSVEFAEDIFFSPNCAIPYISDVTKRGLQPVRPNVLIINSLEKDVTYEFNRDYSAVLVNTDDIDVLKNLRLKKSGIITYGFNSKASVTASSVRDDKITVCVQRAIPTVSGSKIEQQEFNVTISSPRRSNISHMLAGITVALVDN